MRRDGWLASLVGIVVLVGPTALPAKAAPVVENFTMSGTFHCTASGCTELTGTTSTCVETEDEPNDSPPPLLCAARFSATTLTTTCNAAQCQYTMYAAFYFDDASDPGYTIGPVYVPMDATYRTASAAGAGALQFDAEFAAALPYSVAPLVLWSGVGTFHYDCYVAPMFCDGLGGWSASMTVTQD